MATVKGPLFSVDASGQLAGAIVFTSWKGRNVVRRHAVPSNPKSGGQLSIRAMMTFLSQYWVSLTAGEQADWDDRAAAENISPFNAFCSYNLERWGTNLAPSKEHPALESDTAGTIANEAATAQSRAILVEIECTVLAQNWGIQIFRSDTTGLTGTRNQLVHVIPAESAAVFEWLDFPLAVGVAQYYKFQAFSVEGTRGALGGEVNATPTA